MAKIIALDQETINQIAAGEVIERPASIVKELIENSIDAKATAITVEIIDGGIKMIRVTDNGIGISQEDVRNAFLRHSTSKIHSIKDLITISSLGFRGEALASIAAVSQVELITKIDEEITGTRYVIEGGIEKSFEEIGCPTGTTFVINNLFYNTPVRKKFLKSAKTEAGYISELLNKLALGNPNISFKFINNGKVKLHTSGNNNLKECIYRIFDKEIAKNLISINFESDNIKVHGYTGKPIISRANRSYENYYLNGRFTKSKVIQNAIEDAYKEKLTIHRYPFTSFFININPQLVDVNVHPNKMEVRFNNEELVYNVINKSIKKALEENELIPEVSFENTKNDNKNNISNHSPEPFEENRRKNWLIQENKLDIETPTNNNKYNFSYANNNVVDNNISNEIIDNNHSNILFNANTEKSFANLDDNSEINISNKKYNEKNNNDNNTVVGNNENNVEIITNNTDDDKITTDNLEINKKVTNIENNKTSNTGEQLKYNFTNSIDSKENNYKIIGQLFQTYWIVEFEKKYYIIDQHAAHERVLYEKILNNIKEKKVNTQRLLNPVVVNLNLREKERFEQNKQIFIDLGFDIDDFGTDALIIRGVPYIFEKTINPRDFILLLDSLQDSYNKDCYEKILNDVATMACKAAVKANDKISNKEYEQLINDLFLTDNPYNCPHGRPTMISMTKYELEKKFKRIQ